MVDVLVGCYHLQLGYMILLVVIRKIMINRITGSMMMMMCLSSLFAQIICAASSSSGETLAGFQHHKIIHHHRLLKPALCTAYEDITTIDESIIAQKKQAIDEEIVRGPLSLTLQQLSDELDGSGRAAVVWDCLRAGIDPNVFYYNKGKEHMSDDDTAIVEAWISATSLTSTPSKNNHDPISKIDERRILGGRRQGQGLGDAAWNRLQHIMRNYDSSNDDTSIYTIDNSIASLSHMKVSPDGTTKFLLKMKKDGLEVESVIIPWMDKGFSTLCVS